MNRSYKIAVEKKFRELESLEARMKLQIRLAIYKELKEMVRNIDYNKYNIKQFNIKLIDIK